MRKINATTAHNLFFTNELRGGTVTIKTVDTLTKFFDVDGNESILGD